ncbi:MAG: HEAT repeat domain-containing protein [Haloarculaceae archaeon]
MSEDTDGAGADDPEPDEESGGADDAAPDDVEEGADTDDVEDADESEEGEDVETPALEVDAMEARLEEAAEALEAAETETELDDVEAQLDAVGTALEEADLPEPDDEDEEEESPEERIEGRLSELRDDLEEARGPYLEDVTAILEEAEGTLADSEWTEDGETAAVAAVETFLEAANDAAGLETATEGETPAEVAEDLTAGRERLAGLDLDPDDDAETVEELLEAAEGLETDLEEAEVWSDLTVREQLDAQGFYDVLTSKNRKDFPPEWNAVKLYEKSGDVEPILLALETFESDFMEENILDALEHIAPEEAFEAVHERAERRDHQAVRILGRIGDERACETLEDFLGGGDVKLELVTLRALGAIGNAESTQAVANRLVADSADVRSAAARALGQIGDTRAIDPLADVLADDDADEVRASAAWALNQVGTERALEVAADYTDDRSYIVQAEAEKAAGV